MFLQCFSGQNVLLLTYFCQTTKELCNIPPKEFIIFVTYVVLSDKSDKFAWTYVLQNKNCILVT